MDAAWRQKYSSRFFNGNGGNIPASGKKESDSDFYDPNRVRFNDLFDNA